jgi:competence protein ComEA
MDEMDRIDLNQANEEELDGAIEGIGLERARRIVEDREARGPFRSVDDLDRVPGIDDGLRRKIKAVATVRPEPPGAHAP